MAREVVWAGLAPCLKYVLYIYILFFNTEVGPEKEKERSANPLSWLDGGKLNEYRTSFCQARFLFFYLERGCSFVFSYIKMLVSLSNALKNVLIMNVSSLILNKVKLQGTTSNFIIFIYFSANLTYFFLIQPKSIFVLSIWNTFSQ